MTGSPLNTVELVVDLSRGQSRGRRMRSLRPCCLTFHQDRGLSRYQDRFHSIESTDSKKHLYLITLFSR